MITEEAVGSRSSDTVERADARRARLRLSVAGLRERARTAELVKLVLLPGALAVVGGFALMLLGWYGASRTFRPIEQIPYLISGGLVGLGLVFIGGFLLATAMWTAQLDRFERRAADRVEDQIAALEARLRQ
jgi:hypothetical protein